MKGDLGVSLGELDGDGRHRLRYHNADKLFPDLVDMASAFQREESVKRALRFFGLKTRGLQSLSEQLAELAAQAAQKNADAKAQPDRFKLVTSAALDTEDYTPRPIITDTLFAGSPGQIAGLFKVCKTLLAMDAAISIATGRPFLNHFTVTAPLSVAYFSGEGGPSVAQEYGRRIARAKGLELRDVPNLGWYFSVPRLEDLRDLDALRRIHDDTIAEVMFFDNLMLCLSGDGAGNVFRMGGIFNNVICLCNERGITPIFIHHFKRARATADPYAPGELLDLTQAGAAETAGQWLLVTRRQAFDPDQPGEQSLWLNVGGRLGHGALHALDIHEGRHSDPGGRRWQVDVMTPEEARRTVAERKEQDREAKAREQLNRDKTRILRAMATLECEHPEGNAKTTIRDRSCVRGNRLDEALSAALEAHEVVGCDLIRSNHKTPTPGYKLAREETEK
jgi:hypothetical protein